MSTISSFRTIEKKYDVYRGKDDMKKVFEFLREHAMKMIDIKKKKNEVKEKIENKYLKDKKYCKVRDHCHYTAEYRGIAHSIVYSIPKKNHNGSMIIYHKRVSRRI